MKQLDLWQSEVDALPWGGRSPRALTRGFAVSIFKARAVKGRPQLRWDDQLDFFAAPDEGPLYQGAPSLLPLLQEEDDA